MNIVSAGTSYVSVTFVASAGPVLINSMYERITPPGGALRGGLIDSDKSAVDPGLAVIEVLVAAVLGPVRLPVSDVTDARLRIVFVGHPGSMRITMLNVALAPFCSVSAVHTIPRLLPG